MTGYCLIHERLEPVLDGVRRLLACVPEPRPRGPASLTAVLPGKDGVPPAARGAGLACPRCGSTKVGGGPDPDYVYCTNCWCTSFVGEVLPDLLRKEPRVQEGAPKRYRASFRGRMPEYPQIPGSVLGR
jgi:hypothetical protein